MRALIKDVDSMLPEVLSYNETFSKHDSITVTGNYHNLFWSVTQDFEQSPVIEHYCDPPPLSF